MESDRHLLGLDGRQGCGGDAGGYWPAGRQGSRPGSPGSEVDEVMIRNGGAPQAAVTVAKEAVGRAVDAAREELLGAVAELIRTPSVNPNYPGADYDQLIGGEAA